MSHPSRSSYPFADCHMARLTRASRRAGSHSGVSGSMNQATTNGKGLGPSTTLEESRECVNPSAITTSSDTALESKPRKRRIEELQQDGPVSKKTKREDQHPTNNQSTVSLTAGSLYAKPQRAGIFRLLLELKQQILSYGSTRDTARFRRACKSTNQLAVCSTKYLVKLYAGRELSRLREAVNEFNDLKTPSDVDSLVEALHVWTERRGRFAHPATAEGLAFKMMAHFYVKQKRHFEYTAKRPRKPYLGSGVWVCVAGKVAQMMSRPLNGSELDGHISDLASTGFFEPNDLDKLSE
jgi:hypothetical protein